jgi:hypothetical protein
MLRVTANTVTFLHMSKSTKNEEIFDDEDSSLVPSPIDTDRLSDDLWNEIEKLKNPYLRDKKFKPLRKESPKHRQAFLFWMQLADSLRTDRTVAQEFNESSAAVGRWRKSFNWKGRMEYLNRDSLQKVQESALRTTGDDVLKMLSTSSVVMTSFHNQVAAGKVKLTANDFVNIGRFMLQLRKELATDPGGSDAVGRIEAVLNTAGKEVNQLFVNQLQMYVSGAQPLPHDEIIDADASRRIQNVLECREIGDDEPVEFIDGEFDVDEEILANTSESDELDEGEL